MEGMRMRRTRILGLAVVATVALSVVASSATASPVFYTKVEFGATASTPVKFAGTLGPVFFEGEVSKTKFECSGGTLTGEVTGATTTKNAVVTFVGCKYGSGECNSAGEPEHVITTHVLEGALGDVKAGVPGLRLFDEAGGKGAELITFTCFGGAVGVKVRGSVIGQLSGASGNTVSEGKFSASHSLKFVEKDGIQKFNQFLGEEAMEQLELKSGEGVYEKEGFSAVATFTSEGVSNLGFTK
jgi:hypothetical protein